MLQAALHDLTKEDFLKALVQNRMDVPGYALRLVDKNERKVSGEPVFDRFAAAIEKLPESDMNQTSCVKYKMDHKTEPPVSPIALSSFMVSVI